MSESVRWFGHLKHIMATKKPRIIEYPFTHKTKFGNIKIYRNGTPEKHEYIVSWTTAEGRQRKSFLDEVQAHQRADELIDDLEGGMAYRRDITAEKAMNIAFCEKLLEPYKASLLDAVNFFVASKVKKASLEVMAADAVVEYLKKFPDQESRHYKTAKSHLTKFGRHFQKTLNKIVVTELDEYFKSISKVGKTQNGHLGYARTFFKWAQEYRQYLPDGKMEIDKIKPYPEKKKRPDLYEPEDLEKLMKATPDEMIPYMAIGAFAGVRSAEICRLNWDDLRYESKRIRCGPEITKTGSGRLPILHDNLVKWLDAYKGERTGKICPHIERDVHHYTRGIAEKAGLKWKKNALRKGYISSRMAQPDASVGVVAENCGNSPEVIKSNYQGLVMPEYAEKWFGIVPEVAEV